MDKILIIEDEIQIVELIKSYLEKEGFLVDYELDGKKGLEKALAFKPNIIVLDLMLPNMSGEEIIKELRKKSNVHILILSAKSSEESAINCFSLGADDYIRKPFSPRELTAKINAILKKGRTNIIINDESKEFLFHGKKIELTKNEYSILNLLIKNKAQVFTRDDIINALFSDYEAYDRTIDAYIKNIRKKTSPKLIKTIHGLGYKMGEEDEI